MQKVLFAFSLLIALLTSCSQPQLQKEQMVVGSYNLRYYNDGDSINGNWWGQRSPYIAKLIQYHGFDILGTQEGKYHQLQDLKAAMPGYDYIGVGRDDGDKDGEHAAIFYRTEKFDLLDHGDFWLSETPEKPGKGWDAVCVRICTWGKFRVKESGYTFLFFNLHMDHVGVTARAESAKLILKKLQEENPEHLPGFLTGDFNIDQTNESYALLENSGLMRDAYQVAELRYQNTATFNGFRADGQRLASNGEYTRIDHIFLTKEFAVKKYGVLTDNYRAALTDAERKELESRKGEMAKKALAANVTARTPSDHYPVRIVVEFESNTKQSLESARKMAIGTYNLRNNSGKGDSINGNWWGQRYPYLTKLVEYHGFDIFGTQEGLYDQLEDMKAAMPNYDYIGVGRDDGKQGGEYSAVFYRTDKFDLLDHGDFWLGEDTEQPKLGWDAACIRVCTWGKFRHKATGFTFLFFNLHMDHIGVIARQESAKLILKKLQEENPEHLPGFLTGDFNIDQTNESYLLLENSGLMRDAYQVSDFRYINNGTWNDYNTDRLYLTKEEPKEYRRIDHIFLTKDFHVTNYGVLMDTYRGPLSDKEIAALEEAGTDEAKAALKKGLTARNPSDHFPVRIEVEF